MRAGQSPKEQFFTLVSFEGPDHYATCGGLADRVNRLAARLASDGFETHLFFFGAPGLPAVERVRRSRLTLHRWAQWLSEGFPAGVYDGEVAKARELADSLPRFLCQSLLLPSLRAGFDPVIIAEEWQTAPFMIELAGCLGRMGLERRARLLWRTGSMMGWEGIDWHALAGAAEIGATETRLVAALLERGIRARDFPVEPRALLARMEPRHADVAWHAGHRLVLSGLAALHG